MLLVLLSEIIYGLSRYASFFFNDPTEQISDHIVLNLFQIAISCFCNILTLLLTLVITLRILYDKALNRKLITTSKAKQIVIWLMFLFTFITAFVLLLLQKLLHSVDEEDKEGCSFFACRLNEDLGIFYDGLLFVLTIAIILLRLLIPICLKWRHWSQNRKENIEKINDEDDKMSELINESKRNKSIWRNLKCQLMIFPIISICFWNSRFIYEIHLRLLGINHNKVSPYLQLFYYLINSLRGTIYATMNIISHNYLLKMCCPCCKMKSDGLLLDDSIDLRGFNPNNDTSIINESIF